jgi:UDP-GlcNAc:undecaprenyl-phosphate/decaprenyl-phosphate GlcNAc-1-phosphate transferase
MILFSTFLISTIITILLMPIFINLAYKANILDIPDQRKVHLNPIPRVGGIAMGLGAFLPIILWAPMDHLVKSMLIGSGIVVLFGLIDDVKHIGFKPKFVGQIVATLIVILYGGVKIKTIGMLGPPGYLLSDWISIPLTLLVIVAVTNAINLSDGLDGLAGGISLLTFLCIGYLAYSYNFKPLETMSVAMIGAIFGLLRYNTHPAVVFMGDSGSQLLGFFAITISLALTQRSNLLSPVLPLYLIGLPIIDTVWVFFRRISLKKSPFVADQNHLHHKLMALGLYHSESVVSIYLFHAILVCMAFIFRSRSDWFLLTLYFLFSGLMATTAFLLIRNNWKIKRIDFIDKIIKARLRTLKDETNLIKFSFKGAEIVFISLIIFSCFLPAHINIYFSFFSMASLFLIILTWLIKKEWTSGLIEITIFLMIPFLVYFSEKDTVYLLHTTLKKAYTLSFGVLTLFTLLTLKFTRRSGFKTTPMDILILLFALVIPNLPDERIQSWQMGLVAAEIVVLFFSYEVLKVELRLRTKKLSMATLVALSIIGLRGFIA